MEYGKIVAVTGMPGLYELVSSKNDGAIVRSLDDQSSKFVSSRIHNFSHLETIEVYTIRDNVNLVEIFKTMESNSTKLPDTKDNSALRKYFDSVYPDIDFERVYSSDLKKMVKWFEVLNANKVELKLSDRINLLKENQEGSEKDVEEASDVEQETVQVAPPAKKASKPETKTKAAKKSEASKETTPKKKAAKKVAKKKK